MEPSHPTETKSSYGVCLPLLLDRGNTEQWKINSGMHFIYFQRSFNNKNCYLILASFIFYNTSSLFELSNDVLTV
jgi:hypothetical protein